MCLGDDYEPLEEELAKVDDQSPMKKQASPTKTSSAQRNSRYRCSPTRREQVN